MDGGLRRAEQGTQALDQLDGAVHALGWITVREGRP
jgi:hypothetical protein